MALPSTLPLPPHPLEADVLQAHLILQNGYTAARDVVNLGQPDIQQVRYHMERVRLELVPLLNAISTDTSNPAIVSWCFAAATSFADLYVRLTQCETSTRYELNPGCNSCDVSDRPIDSEGSSVISIQPVTTGRRPRGRPCKIINEVYLREAIHPSRSIPKTKLAKVLGIHRNTLKKKMDELGIHSKYSTITDTDLDSLVKEYKVKKPDAGIRYVRGHLRSLGVRVQKKRVSAALRRVDRIGRLIRARNVIRRRKYFSSRPNALWHCDGHHKLIKYGFVIHGFIDGNCRTVCCAVSMFVLGPLTLNLRSPPFAPVPTISPVLSSNSSCQLQVYMVPHTGFVEIGEGKMCLFPHT